MRAKSLTVATCVVLVVLTGCTSGSDSPPPAADDTPTTVRPTRPALERFYSQDVTWSDCGELECAVVEVPLDYSKPGAETLSLKLARRTADDRGKRVGALLVNPGGPGVSGVSYAENAKFFFGDRVLESYDIVGWDPRGVGDSTSVDCLSDGETDAFLAADGTPDTVAEVAQIVRLQRLFTRRCEQNSGDLLPHVGTMDSARDIDILRSVLGEGRTDYFGASYGTELGAAYAELFPERVGRMVLDGALDPRVTSQELAEGQLRGFQRAVSAFLDDCIEREGCPVGPTAAEAEQQVIALLRQIDATPLATDSERELTEALATTGMIASMYDEASGWPTLRLAIDQAIQGDGTLLLALADSYSERNDDGTYASNVNDAFPAISCTDRPDTSSLREIRRTIPGFVRISAIFGRGFAWAGSSCAQWPIETGAFPQALRAKGSSPILVVGTTRDPATPYEWSVGLADQLASGVLLSRDGDGHTAYNAGNQCIDDTIEDYLVGGLVPEDGSTC